MRGLREMRVLTLAALLGLPAKAQDAPDPYRGARAEFDRYSDGFFLGGGEAGAIAFDRVWSLWERRAAEFLDANPSASPARLAVALKVMDPDANAHVETEHGLYLVAPHIGEIGSVFLLARRGGHFRTVWSTRDAARGGRERFPLLAAWQARRTQDGCRKNIDQATCGALYGKDMGFLPPDAKGHPRFYIDATYAQEAGATLDAQLSIWTWDGYTAFPQFADTYAYAFDDQGAITRVEGNMIRVRRKNEFSSFIACGACEGRQMEWTIKLTPNGVADQGRKSSVPELDAVDALFDRLSKGLPTRALAAPQVTAVLKRAVDEQRGNGLDRFTLGLLGHTEVFRIGGNATLCFSADEAGPYLFTLMGRRGGYYIADVREFPRGSASDTPCGGPESR
jgi:hypothetical protein